MRLLDIYKFLVVVLFCSPPPKYTTNGLTSITSKKWMRASEGFSSKLGLVVYRAGQLTIIIKKQQKLYSDN